MTDMYNVDIEWRIRCHECGHLHKKVVPTTGPDVEYSPEPAPRKCDECEYRLRENEWAWHRTFRFVDHPNRL